jgi:putative ABC transport system substrate-binding protein
LALPVSARADVTDDILVLYPDVPDPYIRVFTDIIDGIRSTHPGSVNDRVLPRNARLDDVVAILDSTQLNTVVALGNQAMDMVQQLPSGYLSVSSAILAAPVNVAPDFTAITLAPDPDELFRELVALAPHVKTVHVSYQQVLHGRLMERARAVAASHGLNLEVHRFETLTESANWYRSIFKTLDPKAESVWLLQGDIALRERSVLYHVLKAAWNRKLLVFSSNPSYVSKGVLFSLYPDNQGLGRSIARALAAKRNGDNIGIQHTRDLLIALNIRTAEHLGLNISRARLREIDVVFPRQ